MIEPQGYLSFESFSQEPLPVTVYTFGSLRLERTILLKRDEDVLLLRYRLLGADRPVTLRLRPFLAYRHMHHLGKENGFFNGGSEVSAAQVRFRPYEGMPELRLVTAPVSSWTSEGAWWRNFELTVERDRGFDHHQDLFSPGHADFHLAAGGEVYVAFAPDKTIENPKDLFLAEEVRRQQEFQRVVSASDDDVETALRRSAHTFLVKPRGRWSVCAGYPWFGEWGRDALISLPGLLSATGRVEDCFEVLSTFADARRHGLIPNFLGGGEDSHAYNSADASLWFLRACREWLDRGGNLEAIEKKLWPAVCDILAHFGGSLAPRVFCSAETGLLSIGDRSTQLTWMDAQVHGQPVTPRHGQAVELNALWIDGLAWALGLAAKRPSLRKSLPAGCEALLEKARKSFAPVFVNPANGALFDVVNEEGPDGAVRPNMLFAVGLPGSPLSAAQKAAVMAVAEADLLTPKGPRTLSPRDSRYRGRYEGDGLSRDGAYHQGTVWPWLVGVYVDAALAASKNPAKTATELLERFAPLFGCELRAGAIGSVAEVYDGDPPRRAGGTPSQAWSVAEVFRARQTLLALVSGRKAPKKLASAEPAPKVAAKKTAVKKVASPAAKATKEKAPAKKASAPAEPAPKAAKKVAAKKTTAKKKGST